MKGRTDLAIETVAEKPPRRGRVHQHEYKVGSVTVNELEIMDLAAENEIGRKADKKRKLYNGRIKVDYYQFYGPRPPKREQ